MVEKVNLARKFAAFSEHWCPKVVGQVGDCHVKLVKFRGPFAWHRHEGEDELFLVVKGRFTMHFRDGSRDLETGEMIIVPRGVEHMPEAAEEVEVLLFEPAATLNTGDIREARTVDRPEWL